MAENHTSDSPPKELTKEPTPEENTPLPQAPDESFPPFLQEVLRDLNLIPLDAATPNQGSATLPLSDAATDNAKKSTPQLSTIDPNHYEILGELSRGGLGRILKAYDRRLLRRVVLKEILQEQGQSRERFLLEALVTARLQHPSIVPIHEVGCWPSGELFYAMKMVSGKSLDEVISSAKTLSARIALLPRLIDIIEAIAYAHSEKIIHRDLKPANIVGFRHYRGAWTAQDKAWMN